MKTWSEENWAKLACAYSGLVWGLFWIPLRALKATGMGDGWAILTFYVITGVFALLLIPFRRRELLRGGIALQLAGLLPALSLIAYSIAFLNTSVVKAMLLFYLTPMWSGLLAWWLLGERITPIRWLSMVLGFCGMIVLFGGKGGIPFPSTVGDFLAAFSGVSWAAAAVLLRRDKHHDPLDLVIVDFFWAAIFSGIFLYAFLDAAGPPPHLADVLHALPWLVPALLVVVVTGVYACMWGAPKLNPAVVGLLFMTEISVGAITAAIWSGEPFGPAELSGVILISLAGATESLWELWRKPKLGKT